MTRILLLAVLLVSERSFAQNCPLVFRTAGLSKTDVTATRQKVISYAKTHQLPVFEIILHGKAVPVVLLNKKTLASWNWLLTETMGVSQGMHPENKANHGYTRLPGQTVYFETPNALFFNKEPSAVLMDLYSPDKAGENAAAGTGYRFKSLADYFARRNSNSTEFVDLAFALSREDQVRVWLYHAAKRIALARIQYAFDTPNNVWIAQQRRVLKEGFEHCNNSRCAQMAPVHVHEMRNRLGHFLNKDANVVFNSPGAQRFLDDAKRDLLSRDWRNQSTYNPDFLNTDHYLGLLKSHLKDGLSREQQVDALSYLLAVNIFEETIQIRNVLNLQESRAAQYDNPNISAILIYSEKSERPEQFYQGRLSLDTAPQSEGNNGFRSDYFQVIPTFTELPGQDIRDEYRP